jgi:hypothetical protein
MDRPSSVSVDTLPDAVRARTILSGSHHAWVQRIERSDVESEASLVGVVDVAGAPNLILQSGESVSPGRVRLTCTEVAEGVGVLTVTGELAPGVPVESVPDVLAALHLGGSCLGGSDAVADGCPWCASGQLTVMSMEVVGLRVGSAGAAGRPARTAAVDPERFRSAAPDHWLLHGERSVRHLEERHQAELLAVVRAGGVGGVCAVSVRTADADGLVLTCLAPDGLADVVLPFTPPLRDPRELADRVTWS